MIVIGATRKLFCSEMCVYSHLRADSGSLICYICRHQMQFFNCIRRATDSRSFCSLDCLIAAETSIELLMRNDERCHLNNLRLKCATNEPEPKPDLNGSIEGISPNK